MRGRIGFFIGGFLVCAFLAIILGFAGLPFLANWLVVEPVVETADAYIVLGGGGGSRFAKALALDMAGQPQPLILIDNQLRAWNTIAPDACTSGQFAGRETVCLDGSTSTRTDAELTLQYAGNQGYKKILVVTDPYHSRRAQLIFAWIYAGSPIDVQVVHSGQFGQRLPPDADWWRDEMTLQTVWVEFGKIIYFVLGDVFYAFKTGFTLR